MSTRKTNAEIVLKALLNGQRIKDKDQREYQLRPFSDGSTRLAHACTVYKGIGPNGMNGTTEWFDSEMTLGQFLTLCEQMSESDVILLAGNNALMQMAQEKQEKRR